jgi:uncharacterized protein DUF6798
MLSIYVLASWEVRPLFFSNQNTYFAQGLRLAGVPGLQHDWLSQTRSPHIAFTWLVAALQSLGILHPGAQWLELLLQLCLVLAFWVFSGCHNSREPVRDLPVRFMICAVFLVLLTERGIWSRIFSWGGLADQYLYFGYLQPSEFGIFILIALALLTLERYRLAIGFLVLATTFHVSYLLPCGVVAVTIAADRAYEGQRREAFLLLALFGMGVAPIVAYGLSFGGEAATVARAQTLLAQEIIPQHAWPARWFSFDQLLKIVIMAIGTALAWRYLARVVALAMTGSLLLVVCGTAYVYVSRNSYVGLLFPWRASVFLYPLSLFCILIGAASLATRLMVYLVGARTHAVYKWGALLCGAILATESARELTMRRIPPPEFPFAAVVSNQTAADDPIIIPTADVDLWNRFRLLTMRPTYVDGKSHPYLAAEVLEWKRRVDAVNTFYGLPPAARPGRCREMGASYYVDPSNATSNKHRADDPSPALISCAP